ncbi:MAG: UDP-N-acetylmuramoyl-L-alanyl-D-glutamate--2,6-diaminopimelate ligase [Puniceicoccales bacterium]|jgi:UDP-N-acetylmuramoyl-L-alanyl-D-glutamate--2,6-diaminopimelate ligase|nr:UDP-N-acetylmuramoyl-L-alanyl-D-glutamate--2,6-diaminopimelate ligase [Puniceicoccales bacterium]
MVQETSDPHAVDALISVDLLRDVENFGALKNVRIGQITFDSREVTLNSEDATLFFAREGFNCDGHTFIGDVFQKNSQAIVVSERDLSKTHMRSIRVRDIAKTMAVVAKKFFNSPDEKLQVVAITGTNGKTTTAYLCRAMMNKISKTGMFGTVEYDAGEGSKRQPNTTLAAISLFKMINSAWENGCENLIVEISSHGIMEKRAYGLGVDVAVFTNLSSEHLDFHKNLESYFLAKKNLFDGINGCFPKYAVINVDDEYGRRLCNAMANKGMAFSSFGFSDGADFKISNVTKNDITGMKFEIVANGRRHEISSSLFGKHNLLNIAASFAACTLVHNAPEKFIQAVAEFGCVPGRMDRVDLSNGSIAFIDYAHTPHALETVLAALNAVKTGRLFCVFGCGGNRDSNKRAPMTQIANELSDFAIATSDNPRSEPQEKIFRDMRAGVVDPERIVFIADRREAIAYAMRLAENGDIVLVAGKGHENYQLINGQTFDFSDKDVIRRLDSSKEEHFR